MSRAPSASKTATPASTNKPRIHVIYYSMYGHIATSNDDENSMTKEKKNMI